MRKCLVEQRVGYGYSVGMYKLSCSDCFASSTRGLLLLLLYPLRRCLYLHDLGTLSEIITQQLCLNTEDLLPSSSALIFRIALLAVFPLAHCKFQGVSIPGQI